MIAKTAKEWDNRAIYFQYLNDVSKYPLLTRTEEQELLARIARGDKRALDKLVTANLKFVINIANLYKGQGLDVNELINEGNLGLIEAARRFGHVVQSGHSNPDDLDEAGFEALLCTAKGPPLDLVVRTSGEQRISNFLLWEAAYAELVFQDVLWPDYGAEALAAAIEEYRRRDRRFGGVETHDAVAAG